jgi:EAL domain-containing protein (putative c-di-GMP-specific phosphodiesterase class I)
MHWILALGAELALDVIAEGVETEQQCPMLRLACPHVQDFRQGRQQSGSKSD